MLKSTKMIVITKKNIILFVSFLCSISFGILSILTLINNKNITAFSEYKPIIDSQFSTKELERKESPRIKDELNTISKKIIKNFFLITDIQKDKHEEKIEDPPNIEENYVSSEIKRADRGLEVSNATDININPNDYVNQDLLFKIDDNGPQVLIMHTHTTESYSPEKYLINSPDRDLDEAKNIVAVGEVITQVLNENGIRAYHDKTVHDYPSYNGAYQRAASTIKNDLEAYQGIKVVLDIHRDGITKEDGTKVKLLTSINGTPTAQVMLVVGTNSNLEHNNWKENFKFASKIQAKAIEMYPSLIRPINLRKERFNEQLTLGSLIIEIGTNGNTLEEAIAGGQDIAMVIKEVLKESVK